MISDISLYSPKTNPFYTCWATDLLPDEIDINLAIENISNQKKSIAFIGSINGCYKFGNYDKIIPFVQEGEKRGYNFICNKNSFENPIDNKTQYNIISSSMLSPTIVGNWQQKKGYIPCRIFKTISYGCIGITNSKYVNEVLKNLCIYNEDSSELFRIADTIMQEPLERKRDLLKLQMEYVKENHTYCNRIQDILNVFELKKHINNILI